MRSVKFFVAAGAASLLSSMASAADMAIAPPPMSYAPPPVADFGGWYLRGDIGFSNQRVDSIRNTNPALYANLTSFQETTGFDTGGTYQLGAGYQFNHWFRVDVTGEYRGNTNFHGLDLTSFPNTIIRITTLLMARSYLSGMIYSKPGFTGAYQRHVGKPG